MKVENQGYIHYNKGSVVLYCMREFLGRDTLNSAFKALVDLRVWRTAYPLHWTCTANWTG